MDHRNQRDPTLYRGRSLNHLYPRLGGTCLLRSPRKVGVTGLERACQQVDARCTQLTRVRAPASQMAHRTLPVAIPGGARNKPGAPARCSPETNSRHAARFPWSPAGDGQWWDTPSPLVARGLLCACRSAPCHVPLDPPARRSKPCLEVTFRVQDVGVTAERGSLADPSRFWDVPWGSWATTTLGATRRRGEQPRGSVPAPVRRCAWVQVVTAELIPIGHCKLHLRLNSFHCPSWPLGYFLNHENTLNGGRHCLHTQESK